MEGHVTPFCSIEELGQVKLLGPATNLMPIEVAWSSVCKCGNLLDELGTQRFGVGGLNFSLMLRLHLPFGSLISGGNATSF